MEREEVYKMELVQVRLSGSKLNTSFIQPRVLVRPLPVPLFEIRSQMKPYIIIIIIIYTKQ